MEGEGIEAFGSPQVIYEAMSVAAPRRAAHHPITATYLATYLGGMVLSWVASYSFCPSARSAPTMLSSFLVLGSTSSGQLVLSNACLAAAVLSIRSMQWLVFGPLRVAEWHASWERLLHFSMGQLVLFGAVVDADLGEMVLWGGLAVLVGLLGLYSGICKDRLE